VGANLTTRDGSRFRLWQVGLLAFALAVALGMIPFSAPILMPLRMSVTTVPPWQVVVSLLELALGCWVVVGLSARVYRVGLLMYGKRPRLRELLRWIRVA